MSACGTRHHGGLRAAVAVAFCLATAACGTAPATTGGRAAPSAPRPTPQAAPPHSTTGSASTPITVRAAYASNAVSLLPYYVAERQGFFAQHGIHMVGTVLASSVEPAALNTNEVQYLTVLGPAILAQSKGLPARVLLTFWDANPWTLVGKTDIRSLSQLVGRRVGTTGVAASPHVYLAAALKGSGVPISRVKVVALRGTSDVYKALMSGQLDAGVLSPPFAEEAEAHGLHQVAFLGRAFELPEVGLAAAPSYIAQHHSAVVGTVEAVLQGEQWAVAHAAGSEAILAKQFGISPTVAAGAYKAIIGLASKTGRLSTAAIRNQLQVAKGLSQTSTQGSLSRFVNYGPLSEAEKAVGMP